MADRLTRIYTRSGDRGTTGLGDGTRHPKDSARIEAIGSVDELNSALGLVLAQSLPDAIRAALADVQNDLFDLGGELAMPGRPAIDSNYVARLERTLDGFNTGLPPLREFVLPGGDTAAAACHMARSICRRAERRVVTLGHDEPVREEVIAYLNRLSDLLFVIARVLARAAGAEVYWQPGRSSGRD